MEQMWKLDDKGRMVEELHHPDGRVEIFTYMGRSIEEPSIIERIKKIIKTLILVVLAAVGFLIGKCM